MKYSMETSVYLWYYAINEHSCQDNKGLRQDRLTNPLIKNHYDNVAKITQKKKIMLYILVFFYYDNDILISFFYYFYILSIELSACTSMYPSDYLVLVNYA